MQRNDRLILKSFTKTQYVLTVLNSLVVVLEKINESAKVQGARLLVLTYGSCLSPSPSFFAEKSIIHNCGGGVKGREIHNENSNYPQR